MSATRGAARGATAAELRSARAAAGLTQKEAALLCEVGLRTYHRWESGEARRIRSVYLDRLREAALRRRAKPH